ncbi:MAG: Crp/Fnr family transcriptional regulator, partial [Ilumatobacteraceae bacterium]
MPRTHLLDRLEPATRAAVLDAGTQVDVPAGGFLIRDGEDGRSVFLVLDGLLKVVKNSYDGRVSFLGLRRGGTLVGELAVLTGEPRNSSLQAVWPSTVVKLPDDRFERLLAEHASLSRALLMEIAERLGEATRQIHDLMNADARTRIAARLVQLVDETLDPSA